MARVSTARGPGSTGAACYSNSREVNSPALVRNRRGPLPTELFLFHQRFGLPHSWA